MYASLSAMMILRINDFNNNFSVFNYYLYDTYIMENIIIDLKLKITDLEQENNVLKSKINLMYSNWKFDYGRFMELKASIYKMNNKTESEPESIQSISDTIS